MNQIRPLAERRAERLGYAPPLPALVRRSTAEGDVIHIVQGEQHVSEDPNLCIATLLGSCVAACLRDPVANVGGMNHFLLPGSDNPRGEAENIGIGVHAMELLVNALLAHGARRERIEAKLFGGGRVVAGLTAVGEKNAQFAEDFLRREGIQHVGGSLRGDAGRRLQYWPVSGRARQVFMASTAPELLAREIKPVIAPRAEDSGELDLF
ncbi:chemotaxis protein CheD [Phenylobacterium sp. LjRoot225]|uniref:chemotaxis protein CheD n=1 Tax=Phenylobacterium sp. LjRoot225 TaxID=3342285 RepID=UPI003ECDC8CB